jgi:hypothetical protein
MTMRSPVLAMLWEIWRLTRTEAVWHLALGVVAASAVLVVSATVAPSEALEGLGAVVALVLLALPHIVGWFSINMLTATRTGFPFYLLFIRPVRTAVVVGVSMAYWAGMPAALYLVSALVLRITSGNPFPLLSVAAWIAALNLTSAAVNWSIRNLVVRTLGHMAAGVAWTSLAVRHLGVDDIPGPDLARPHQWPAVFDLPLTEYALFGAIGLASFVLTVAAVARQRRGDGRAAIAWTPGDGFPDRLVSLFRFACPTSSATRAQVWFELRSRGLPLLTIGVALAIVNPLLFAAGDSIDAALFDEFRPYVKCRVDGCFYARPFALLFAGLSMLTVVGLGANAFGIRWKPGRRYVSAFEATQPCATARLAGVKVLVRSICVLAACIAVGISVWASQSFIAADKGFQPIFGVGEPLDNRQRAIESAIEALTGYQQLGLAVVTSIGTAVWVASWAALGALGTRYPRRVNIAFSLLLLHGLVLVLRAPDGQGGNGLEVLLVEALSGATPWIAATGLVLATGYLSWRGFAEQLLTLRHASAAVLVSGAFGAAWLTLLSAAGVSLTGLPATEAIWMLSPALLPLMASVVAPWSLSRIRHT